MREVGYTTTTMMAMAMAIWPYYNSIMPLLLVTQ